MMTLTNAVTRVCARLNKNLNDSVVTTRIKNHINDVCQEKWSGYAWSFRYREYPLVLSAQVTSGTLTATNGSQTVTASGTPFVAGTHEGAWLRFTADTLQAWYRVRTVSSASAVIVEPAYQDVTGSGKAYQLCKTDYLLPTEASDVGTLKINYNGSSLRVSHQLMTDTYNQPPLSVGVPYLATVFNQSQTVSTYTTGTLSGTINTRTLTGVGTAWLSNVRAGDEVLIGSSDTNYYRVHSVDSDTQITLYNNLVLAAAGANYVISRQYGKVVRMQPCSDNSYVCFVKALRSYAPLINNTDTNELLIRYPAAVLEGAIWREAGSSPDPREDSLYQRSEFLWQKAQSEDEAILPQNNYNPIFDARGRY